MSDGLPPEGAYVEVSYKVTHQGVVGDRTSVTLQVDEVLPSAFVGGPGIGMKVTQGGAVYAPTSSDGFHADGDQRIRVGIDATWDVTEVPDETPTEAE